MDNLKILTVIFIIAVLFPNSLGFNLEEIKKANIRVKDIFLQYIKWIAVSQECFKAYKETSKFIDMVDASAKIPSGIASYNLMDVGNYDQCMNIFDKTIGPTIYGKYCLASLPLKSIETFNTGFSSAFYLGYCTPHQCSRRDLTKIINGLMPRNGSHRFYVDDYLCYTKADVNCWSAGAIATLMLIIVFAGLVFLSSLYDIYLRYYGKKALHELMISFSMMTNGEKLFKSTTNPDQLLCLNGVRAISMMWVIFGHEYSILTLSAIKNYADVGKVMIDESLMFLHNAPYSVDSFFMMGGLVTMYTFLKAHDKGAKFNIFLYYLHRYLRLTPAVAILVLFHGYLLPYMGNGPFWGSVDPLFSEQCRDNWWSSLLYIQNYENHSCIAQTWYLSVDMQLFFLSPLVLLPSAWFTLFCRRYLLGCLTILGWMIPTVISYQYKLSSIASDRHPDSGNAEHYNDYYNKTHCRYAVYIIGLFFGDIIYQFKKTDKTFLNKKLAIIFWIFGFGLLWICLYGPAPLMNAKVFHPLAHAFLNGFGRSGWAIGLGIIIYLCVTGYGGFVNSFLSSPLFQFLAKLSYSMYLIHGEFIGARVFAARDAFYFSHLSLMHIFWADFMVVLIISFFFSLTFESPIIILEKHLLGNGKTKNDKINPPTINTISAGVAVQGNV